MSASANILFSCQIAAARPAQQAAPGRSRNTALHRVIRTRIVCWTHSDAHKKPHFVSQCIDESNTENIFTFPGFFRCRILNHHERRSGGLQGVLLRRHPENAPALACALPTTGQSSFSAESCFVRCSIAFALDSTTRNPPFFSLATKIGLKLSDGALKPEAYWSRTRLCPEIHPPAARTTNAAHSALFLGSMSPAVRNNAL